LNKYIRYFLDYILGGFDMELRNCKKCGKLHYGTGRICSECLRKEEEKFELVKKYLKEHPDSALIRVSEETGVTVSEIERFLREGRLEVTAGMGDYLRCMKCGNPIKSGKYCADCGRKVMDDVKTVYRAVSGSDPKLQKSGGGPKMHTAFGRK